MNFCRRWGKAPSASKRARTIKRTRDILARIDHADTSMAIACERAFLAALDGSCKTPIAGHATVSGDAVQFRGLIARPDGSAAHDIAGTGQRKDAANIGAEAGRELKHRAGRRIFRLNHAPRRHPPASR